MVSHSEWEHAARPKRCWLAIMCETAARCCFICRWCRLTGARWIHCPCSSSTSGGLISQCIVTLSSSNYSCSACTCMPLLAVEALTASTPCCLMPQGLGPGAVPVTVHTLENIPGPIKTPPASTTPVAEPIDVADFATTRTQPLVRPEGRWKSLTIYSSVITIHSVLAPNNVALFMERPNDFDRIVRHRLPYTCLMHTLQCDHDQVISTASGLT